MSFLLTASTVLPILRSGASPLLGASRVRLEEEVVALFEELRDPMLRYLLSFGLTIPDSEEITQEAFLSLFQHLRQEKSRGNLPGWLFRVAHNMALKRRIKIRRDVETRIEAVIEDLAADTAPNPEDRVLNREMRKNITALVDGLPEQDRQCLSLRAEGLRYRQIAEVLGISLGSVSLSLTRSLARIARSIER